MTKPKPHNPASVLISLAIFLVAAVFPVGTPPWNPFPGPSIITPRAEAAAPAPRDQSPSTQTPTVTTPTEATIAHAPPGLNLPAYPHPQYKYTAMAGSAPTGPLYSMEPFLNRISAPSGWAAAGSTNAAPTVAVIDTGFALNHENLINRWTIAQWDFVHGDNNPLAGSDNPNGSSVFHGTMTAGLAGLLNASAKIMPVQALGDDGVGYTDEIAGAVTYAADHGAKVISMSLGSDYDDPYLHQQIDYAIAKGVLVVAAAGNNGCNCLSYPAAYPEVLAVGATTSSDNRASFSSYGSNLDVMAPGTAGDVCSDFYTASNATNAYTCSYSGTSFATPLAASLAALLAQQQPGLTPAALTAVITQSADKVTGMAGQYTTVAYGYGRIDMARAVSLVSLKLPAGQVLNKQSISLSSSDPATSPQMATTCTGVPGATCTVTLTGPANQSISLGQQVLDAQYGGAVFSWNAATLGLTPGQWTISETQTIYGQTSSLPSVALAISP